MESLVLHHGDRKWNAPTRLRDLFLNSAPDTYRLVERLPPHAPPQGPLDLPQRRLRSTPCGSRDRYPGQAESLRSSGEIRWASKIQQKASVESLVPSQLTTVPSVTKLFKDSVLTAGPISETLSRIS